MKKLRTAMRVLSERGLGGLTDVLADKRRRSRATLDGCEFLLQGVQDEGLRNGFLFGDYEQYERTAVGRYVATDLPVVELGACMGVVSCVTNRRLRQPDRHVVVEANPKVIPFLQRNRRHNGCRFHVLNAAIAYGQDAVEYAPTSDFAGNSMHETRGAKKVRVRTTSLQSILERYGFHRYTLICDIEGHERELVEREAAMLERAALIILETHARLIGEEANARLLGRLEQLGFDVVDESSNVVVLRNRTAKA